MRIYATLLRGCRGTCTDKGNPNKITLIRRVPIERPGAANSLAGGEKCNVIEHMQGVAYLRLLRHVTF